MLMSYRLRSTTVWQSHLTDTNRIKQAGAELGQAQLKLGFEFIFFCKYFSLDPVRKLGKIIQWSPLWIIFKGEIEIAHLMPSRQSFFANLTTFEWRSGLKIFSLLEIANLKMG